ncbi:MAG: hypothetical protein KBS76_03815 [Ruminococcus sp.]|nr:hypothetical protein [Candidatus Apopatosoma intestinale]
MKKETIDEVLGGIEDRFLVEAAKTVDDEGHMIATRRMRRYPGRGLIAACLAAVILAGSGIGAYAAETSKLHAATAFFEEYGLPMEGLKNCEVKAVYQDISAQKFTYGKTADVIRNAVSGCELPSEDVTPEELMVFWNANSERKPLPQTGIGYQKGYEYKMDRKLGYHVLEKSVLECYLDGELVWSVDLPEFYLDGSVSTVGGTVAWGRSYPLSGEQPVIPWIALVDDFGNILWKRTLGHGFQQEKIASVLDNGDGTFAVISCGEDSVLCFSQWDVHGAEMCLTENDIGYFGVGLVARFLDGYLVQVGSFSGSFRYTRAIIRLDREGKVINRLTFQDDHQHYTLTDMIEYEGMIYLSAYSVPCPDETLLPDESVSWGQIRFGMTLDEIVTLYGRVYAAQLLVLDPATGVPERFYRVSEGALGGELSTDGEGRLNWNVQKIKSVYSFHRESDPDEEGFELTLEVYRYCFDKTGELVDSQKTGGILKYGR